MLSREGLCSLVFGHANATTWIANATAGSAMQAQQRKGGLKRLSSVPQKNAPPTTMGDRGLGWVGGEVSPRPFTQLGPMAAGSGLEERSSKSMAQAARPRSGIPFREFAAKVRSPCRNCGNCAKSDTRIISAFCIFRKSPAPCACLRLACLEQGPVSSQAARRTAACR
jgi:hypothetical protein